ncbi:MAG TPA: DEAD/DEAH box helicase family protein [Clostridiaceae bacterium]|nr:DEAD/DEAH box helicase family protein [Clostridiaceae bacterium]
MISSHNLTLCNVYEVGIVLESKENSRKSPNHNIHDLLKYIVENSSREDNDFIKQFEQYVSELADLVFVNDTNEFEIEWEKTIDGKPKAKVNINLKSSEGVEITVGEMNALKLLPYSMSEKNSSTAVKKEKWEEFKINRRINFVDAKSTKETQILRLRYDDGFNIHEVLWYDVNNLVNSEYVLGKQLDEFFQMPYASLFQRDKELYWGEFWNKYKTFCDVYKNNIDILNMLDRMYRRVWASYCVLSNRNKDIYPIRLPAAIDRHIGLMPYQKSVINQVMNSFYERKQKLFLVADEAGLGKTYIAQGVMKAMFKKWNEDKQHKEHKTTTTFNVAYFGSNLFLLDRTAEKLIKRPGGSIDTDFNKLEEIDRFSMIPKVFIESNLPPA